MCGIFGFATSKNFTQQRILYHLLSVAMENRGRCSYGVTYGDINGDIMTVRGLGSITDDSKLVASVANSRLLLGHTRLATHGDTTVENAHPFDVKGCLVAHNGIIYNSESLAKSDGRTYNVDSQALAWRVALDLDVDDCRGYGSVTWFDRDDRLFVSRMRQGDLVTFTLNDESNGSKAHVFVSSDSAKVSSGLDLKESLDLFGFTVENRKEPNESKILGVTPGGFRKQERVLELSAGYSNYGNYGYWNTSDASVPNWKTQYRWDTSKSQLVEINNHRSRTLTEELVAKGNRNSFLKGHRIDADSKISSISEWGIVGSFFNSSGDVVLWRLRNQDESKLFTYVYSEEATEKYLVLGGDISCSAYQSEVSGLYLIFEDEAVCDLYTQGVGDPEDSGIVIMSGMKAEDGGTQIIIIDQQAFNKVCK